MARAAARRAAAPPVVEDSGGGPAPNLTTASNDSASRTEAQSGAQIGNRYLRYDQDVVPVPVTTLEGFRESSVEEFKQFAAGEFFAAGSFWLLVERAATIDRFWADLLFWVCVAFCLAGSIVGYFGYTQLRRRQTEIDRIIAAAKKNANPPPAAAS